MPNASDHVPIYDVLRNIFEDNLRNEVNTNENVCFLGRETKEKKLGYSKHSVRLYDK